MSDEKSLAVQIQSLAWQNVYILTAFAKAKSQVYKSAFLLSHAAPFRKDVEFLEKTYHLVGFTNSSHDLRHAYEFLTRAKLLKSALTFVAGKLQTVNWRFLNRLNCYQKSLLNDDHKTHCVRIMEGEGGHLVQSPCQRAMAELHTKEGYLQAAIEWDAVDCPHFDIENFKDLGPAPKKYWNE